NEEHIVVHTRVEARRRRIRDVEKLITDADPVVIAEREANAGTKVEEEVQTGRIRCVDWHRFGGGDNAAARLEEWPNGAPCKVCSEPNGQHSRTIDGVRWNNARS